MASVTITKLILDHKITYTKATPSEYLLWLQYRSSSLKLTENWRFAFGGGDQLLSTVTKEFSNLNLPQLRFFNSYGPAEITISSTKMEMLYSQKPPGSRFPCGYSLPNYAAYILDNELMPVQVGTASEIVLAGAGVSFGYLNNEIVVLVTWLGLSENEFWRLSEEVDVILHMGVARSIWDNYHALRLSNVLPTKQIVTVASARRIPIHYPSTVGVFLLVSLQAQLVFQLRQAYLQQMDQTDMLQANGQASSRHRMSGWRVRRRGEVLRWNRGGK